MLLPMGVVFGDEMEKHVVDESFFGTTSSSHLEINPVGSPQIESSNGSLSDLLTSNLEQVVLFFKGSESMKFYTHHISSA